MIVPFAKGQTKGASAQQAQPSETDMLMALAHMHSIGRIPDNMGPSTDQQKGKNLIDVLERLKQDPQSILRKDGPSDKMLIPGESIPDQRMDANRDVRGT